MQSVFISELKLLLDAVAEQMDLYVPKKAGLHYVYNRYDSAVETPMEFNNIRTCTPVKEFLLPLCELAAVFPEDFEPEDIKPFAVFGLENVIAKVFVKSFLGIFFGRNYEWVFPRFFLSSV